MRTLDEYQDFVMYLEDGDFWEICFADVHTLEGTRIVQRHERFDIKSKALKQLCKIHLSHTVNAYVRIPGKGIWKHFDRLYDYITNGVNSILFTDTSIREFDKSDLLRYKGTGCKLYLLFLNTIKDDKIATYAHSLANGGLFDGIYTIDKDNAAAFGYEFTNTVYSKDKSFAHDEEYITDCFFVANAKGRERLIFQVCEALEGLDYKFYISEVQDTAKCVSDKVIYNKHLSYSEVLKFVKNSRCIVEILQEGQMGFTFRTYEALCYDKKLITNNTQIRNMCFFDPRYIKVIEDPSDFDELKSFVLQPDFPKYDIGERFSPRHLVDLIKENREIGGNDADGVNCADNMYGFGAHN